MYYLRYCQILLCFYQWSLVKSHKNTIRKSGPVFPLNLDLDMCYHKTRSEQKKSECNEAPLCKKKFNITHLKITPYSIKIAEDLLHTYCGNCINITCVQKLNKTSQIVYPQYSNYDLAFPVLARSSTEKMFGYYFLPLIETPTIYYITNKEKDLVNTVISSCFSMWPLVIICIMLSIISGFVCWLTETWKNEGEFPRTFLIGWFEGIWWSVISMTTVGYGDKVPKSVAGRLFTIMWIFTGITIFSLVTAMLTSEITKANSQPPPKMTGARVGAIKHRLYDAIFVAKKGGLLIEIEEEDFMDGLHNLVLKLRANELDGFVIDRYTLLLFYQNFTTIGVDIHVMTYLKTETDHTEMQYEGVPQAYGLLIKNKSDFQSLHDYFVDNQEVINTCNLLLLNDFSKKVNSMVIENPLFTASGSRALITITIVFCLVIAICCFGVIYESLRKCKRPSALRTYLIRQKTMLLDERFLNSQRRT